jgi:hypothetical protein
LHVTLIFESTEGIHLNVNTWLCDHKLSSLPKVQKAWHWFWCRFELWYKLTLECLQSSEALFMTLHLQSTIFISTSLFSIFHIFHYLDEILKVPIFFLLSLYWKYLFILIFLSRYFQYLEVKFQAQQSFSLYYPLFISTDNFSSLLDRCVGNTNQTIIA